MSDVVDLDAFNPESVTVKLGGVENVIHPPRILDVLRIGSLSNKLKGVKSDNIEALEKAFIELAEAVKKIVPELDVDSLSMAQLFKVVSIISSMATPKDVEELEKKGITVDADPKAPPA